MDRRRVETAGHQPGQLVRSGRDPTAGSAECERRPDDEWKRNLCGELPGFVERMYDRALDRRLPDPFEQRFEELAIFRHLDGVELRAEQPYAVLLQDAELGHLHGEIQPGLSTKRGQQAIRSFAL